MNWHECRGESMTVAVNNLEVLYIITYFMVMIDALSYLP